MMQTSPSSLKGCKAPRAIKYYGAPSVATALRGALTALFIVSSNAPLAAHMTGDHNHKIKAPYKLAENKIVPESEAKQAIKDDLKGPKKTEGVKAVRLLGTVALEGELKDVENRMLRAREIDVEPGGVVAVHRHNGRPGVAYVISGEMTEYRDGAGGPAVKKPGDTAFEKTGVIHWWRNEGKTIARVIVVDIIPKDLK